MSGQHSYFASDLYLKSTLFTVLMAVL
ncbi:putative ankyrin repeat protein [Megavirus courdo7]|uniref:Putative ankyrin repeat protein n=1 Tax=Megavirus courdo7 TaxID=1128135 RepID=H2E9Q3_9VIRU|nr:putative ankyrin repeat protein [Megavirus courdo7]